MRPEPLFPLFASLESLPGIGAKLTELIERVAGPTVRDLCFHLPTKVLDRRHAPDLATIARESAELGPRLASPTVRIDEHRAGGSRRSPYRIIASDPTGSVEIAYFNAKADYLQRILPVGERRIVSGRFDLFDGRLQLVHPDAVGREQEAEQIRRLEAQYGLTKGLTHRPLRKAVEAALDTLPELSEWLDPALQLRRSLPSWRGALQAVHNPITREDIEPTSPARTRLAYDELLATQLALGLMRHHRRAVNGRALTGSGSLRSKVMEKLPFSLTRSQRQAIDEILADMASPEAMVRLLQGDVGSGKTVVALLAMIEAVDAGTQAAFMAPTEILARQHYQTITSLAGEHVPEIALLTGKIRAAERRIILEGLGNGTIRIVVGTHALLQGDLQFRDLGLAVIDEQHRFGVAQRMALTQRPGSRENGDGDGTENSERRRPVDLLAMTATPIPRTLLISAYGDLPVSKLEEKPANRKPIATSAIPDHREEEVIAAIGRTLENGNKVYWICPLVAESEEADLADAESRFEKLGNIFGDRVALLHGRLNPSRKEAVMKQFASGEHDGDGVDILVATTVVEVGVDVPSATVIVIEQAERFGLAQLHQLRGRVGRGAQASSCILLFSQPLSQTARARLAILRETEDGFRIAEEDLRLRGGGDVLGLRQSGLPSFKLVDFSSHAGLLDVARDDAKLIVETDPELASPRGQALRILLYLFGRDDAVRTLRSG